MDKELLKYIVCPVCKKELEIVNNSLVCIGCKEEFPVKNGIPFLLPKEKKKSLIRDIYSKKDVAKNFGIKPEYTGSVRFRNILRDKAAKVMQLQSGTYADIGCGNGLLLEKVAKVNKDLIYFGIDISEKMLLETRKRLEALDAKFYLLLASIEALPFKNKSIDNCSCVDTLKNFGIESQKISIKELLRVCSANLFFEVVANTWKDNLIRLAYRALIVLRIKQLGKDTALSGIAVNSIDLNLVKAMLRGKGRISIRSVSTLINWKIIEVKC